MDCSIWNLYHFHSGGTSAIVSLLLFVGSSTWGMGLDYSESPFPIHLLVVPFLYLLAVEDLPLLVFGLSSLIDALKIIIFGVLIGGGELRAFLLYYIGQAQTCVSLLMCHLI